MPDDDVSFAKDIRPLFRQKDIEAMKTAFDLSDYDDVKSYADGILQKLAAGSMPCDGAWPPEQVSLFRRWARSGRKP